MVLFEKRVSTSVVYYFEYYAMRETGLTEVKPSQELESEAAAEEAVGADSIPT